VAAGVAAGNLVPMPPGGPNGRVPGAGTQTRMVPGAELTP